MVASLYCRDPAIAVEQLDAAIDHDEHALSHLTGGDDCLAIVEAFGDQPRGELSQHLGGQRGQARQRSEVSRRVDTIEHALPQPGKHAPPRKKFGSGADIDHPAAFEHDHLIARVDEVQTRRCCNHDATIEIATGPTPELLACLEVEAHGGITDDHDLCLAQKHTCQANARPILGPDRPEAAPDERVRPVGVSGNEGRQAGGSNRGIDLFGRRLRAQHREVLGQSGLEHHGARWEHGNMPRDIAERRSGKVDVVEQDPSARRSLKTCRHSDDRFAATANGTDQHDPPQRRRRERDVAKSTRPVGLAVSQVLNVQGTGLRWQGQRSCGLIAANRRQQHATESAHIRRRLCQTGEHRRQAGQCLGKHPHVENRRRRFTDRQICAQEADHRNDNDHAELADRESREAECLTEAFETGRPRPHIVGLATEA